MAGTAVSSSVKLGFVEEDSDLRLLHSHFFPSKVGGKPAWLALNNLPSPEKLQCSKCNGPTVLLLQVYSPIEIDSRDDTFHRTVFVFSCHNPACCSHNYNGNFKVFRSQLPLENRFFSKDPPDEKLSRGEDMDKFPHAGIFQALCAVCGASGTKKCSKCKTMFYCCKTHQVAHWKSGHKQSCADTDTDSVVADKSSVKSDTSSIPNQSVTTIELFKEFDLVTEDEDFDASEGSSNTSRSEEDRLAEYQQLMHSPQMKEVEGKYIAEELEETAAHETEDDQHFLKFKKRVGHEPDQVLRYDRNGEPLWVSAYHKPQPGDIPACHCGAERVFEFQVMPQLLNYMNVDKLGCSLDWGTLCVYSCKNSCPIGDSYSEEFIWKQDFHGKIDGNL